MEHKALGRGISALIPVAANDLKDKIINVQTGQIKPNPYQPREDFATEGLEELVQSIREKGVIQPILVRRRGDDYELIAGERRLRAATQLGLESVPVIVKDVDDENSLELALIENIQREDLNPIEEAKAYQYLSEKFNITQERISEILGKSRAAVTNMLRLLKLPKEIQDELRKGRLSYAHGRALLEVENENEQRRLAQEAISKGLSVREIESLVKSFRPRKPKRKAAVMAHEPLVAVLEEELQHLFATKVRINKRNKRGQIVIDFYSPEDLQRIAAIVRGGDK